MNTTENASESFVYSESFIKRFFEKVNKDGPVHPYNSKLGKCWIWIAGKSNQGYGRIRLSGYYAGRILAHRASYQIHHQKIVQKEKQVCHSCDNTSCVNPEHLWIGDHLSNAQDKEKKGRHNAPKGTNHFRSAFTENDIKNIRKLIIEGYTHGAIAKQFGVVRGTISSIHKRKTWSHVA